MTVRLVPGAGGLPKAVLAHPSGSSAEVYLHGGHVTSWIPAGGNEALYLSGSSQFRPGSAIRGGVPVIFPQFADLGPLPKHGFARTETWTQVDSMEGGKGEGRRDHAVQASSGSALTPSHVTLRLGDSATSRAVWPHAFRLELGVRLEPRALEFRLSATNTGERALEFTAALHTYLRVRDVCRAALLGLQGVRYRDRAAGGLERTQERAELVVAGEIDRAYLGTPGPLFLEDRAGGRRFVVGASGFTDTVVWNPWELARKLSDLDDLGYLEMLCVEAAVVEAPVKLEPGAAWSGVQRLEAEL